MAVTKCSIFYDLETTSLYPVGQIVNYCFIAVDENWKEFKRLQGLVRISLLQLPEPGAVEVTNLDIFDHQDKANCTERDAASRIHSFLQECKRISGGQPPLLIGQNSAGFDLNFLRTTFIRNGISPYGLFEPKDLLFVSRYLFATNESFRKRVPPVIKREKQKLALSLEHLARSFGLLQGDQLHESSFDVELSIALARFYKNEFEIDVRNFDSYGLRAFHNGTAQPVSVAEFRQSLNDPMKCSWKLFLRQEGSGALWVDLEAFLANNGSRAEALQSVRRYKIHGHLLWPGKDMNPPQHITEAARMALSVIPTVDAEELFGGSNCYIEQFIYRIPPQDLELLFKTLADYPNLTSDTSADIVTLARRHWIENCPIHERSSKEYQSAFRRYCLFRYGGKLLLSNTPADTAPKESDFYPTLKTLMGQIEQGKQNSSKKDLFEKLERFYLDSEVVRAVGSELL